MGELAVLVVPVAVLAVLGTAVVAWRMMRTTGLERVEAGYVEQVEEERRPGPMSRLIDVLGIRFERTLLQLTGQRRLVRLEKLLDQAGRPDGLSARTYIRRQAGMAALGVIAGIFFLLGGQPVMAAVTALGMALWMDLWIRSAAGKRQQAIAREMPDFLDVLAVTVSAGLSLRASLQRVSAAGSSPLAQEIRRVLDDMQLGMSRREALVHLRERNGAQSVESWVSAMLQAEELGAPLGDTLQEIAQEVRRERAGEVRKLAAKAAPKISLVVTMLIVPGALLLIVASLFLSQLDTLTSVFSG